ncbi:EmrB/QacA family drug resistance transporter, partial [Xanthomonas perforans]
MSAAAATGPRAGGSAQREKAEPGAWLAGLAGTIGSARAALGIFLRKAPPAPLPGEGGGRGAESARIFTPPRGGGVHNNPVTRRFLGPAGPAC